MTRSAAARLAKLLLVILALWMPFSTFAAAATPTTVSDVETPSGEPASSHDGAETPSEDDETPPPAPIETRRAHPGARGFRRALHALLRDEREKPPHQPPNPAGPR